MLTARKWSSIEDLPANWRSLASASTAALVDAWQSQAAELRQKESYKQFLVKLRRQWAIETGVLERLYSLSEGATKTLIEKGFDAALISHEDTDRAPSEVLALISDQQEAIEGLYQFISGSRPLSTSYIKELHQTMTRHQLTYDAFDTLGNRVERALPRGEWKKFPNNVSDGTGVAFEFAPPEQVASEMDRLIDLHLTHEENGVPPDLEAAWLHHRFTLIHPFTDGNGRVARCLATLVLLRKRWFPLVVTRKERVEYIASLRDADAGSLGPLINLFNGLQSKAIRQALSLSEETIQEATAIKGILSSVKAKYSRMRMEEENQKKQVLVTGDALHLLVAQRLDEVAGEIDDSIHHEGVNFNAYRSHAPRSDSKAGYNYYQIIRCAKSLDYYANREIFQSWAAINIVMEFRTEVLFSFHGIGRDSSGVLVCSAMAYTRQTTDTDMTLIGEVTPIVDEPFYFTHAENLSDVSNRFRKWLDLAILTGLNYWRKAIGA